MSSLLCCLLSGGDQPNIKLHLVHLQQEHTHMTATMRSAPEIRTNAVFWGSFSLSKPNAVKVDNGADQGELPPCDRGSRPMT